MHREFCWASGRSSSIELYAIIQLRRATFHSLFFLFCRLFKRRDDGSRCSSTLFPLFLNDDDDCGKRSFGYCRLFQYIFRLSCCTYICIMKPTLTHTVLSLMLSLSSYIYTAAANPFFIFPFSLCMHKYHEVSGDVILYAIEL
jgi:hypothetical protein